MPFSKHAFAHLREVVLVPVVRALYDRGVFKLFAAPGAWIDLDQIVAGRAPIGAT